MVPSTVYGYTHPEHFSVSVLNRIIRTGSLSNCKSSGKSLEARPQECAWDMLR